MPIDISALRKKAVKVAVEFYGDRIMVEYDPIKVSSPTFREEFNKRRDALRRESSTWIQDQVAEFNAQEIPEDFPHRDRLIEAGCQTVGDIPTNTDQLAEDLNFATIDARQVISEINRRSRIDDLDLQRRMWAMQAELAVMLIKDWDIHESGEPIPVEAEAFNGHPLPPQLANQIIDAIWQDANSLGNPPSSNGTKPG